MTCDGYTHACDIHLLCSNHVRYCFATCSLFCRVYIVLPCVHCSAACLFASCSLALICLMDEDSLDEHSLDEGPTESDLVSHYSNSSTVKAVVHRL